MLEVQTLWGNSWVAFLSLPMIARAMMVSGHSQSQQTKVPRLNNADVARIMPCIFGALLWGLS
jgi:hypothetical protein